MSLLFNSTIRLTELHGIDMANNAVVSSLQQCQQKKMLIDQIRQAISFTLSIHNEELDDTINGSAQAGDWYAHRLRNARENRLLLIESLGRHVGEHGC